MKAKLLKKQWAIVAQVLIGEDDDIETQQATFPVNELDADDAATIVAIINKQIKAMKTEQ